VVGTVVPVVMGLVFVVPGGLLLYGSVRDDPRWPTQSLRAIAVLSGFAFVALGAGLIAGAFASGATRRDLIVTGGVIALGCAAARWLVRYRLERRGEI
jgi:hypothetical protein